MEPANKRRSEIEPEITPQFGVIQGGGESTPERGDLQQAPNDTSSNLNDQERNFGVIQGGGESTPERGDLRTADDEAVSNQFGWQDGNNSNKQKPSFAKRVVKLAKGKKGPAAFLGGGLAGIFALIAFFGGPSLVLVHMSEIFSEALDQQHVVLETRYRKVAIAKLEKTTSGACSRVVSFRCKYGSFSERELKSFRDNGIEVLDSEGKPLLGEDGKRVDRDVKAAKLQFDDKQISAKAYQKELRNNAAFRNANILSMNTKFIGLFDSKFFNYFSSVKASKADPFKGAKNDEDRDKMLTERTKEGVERAPRATGGGTEGECDAACQQQREQDTERANRVNELGDEAERNAVDNIRNAKPGFFGNLANKANAIGGVNDLCTVPMAIDAVGVGAKVVRNRQMVRYASTFLSLASMVKAGKATSEDMSYAGKILTETKRNSETGIVSKPATDGFAFRNAAYGDKGLTESAGLALGAGGLGGSLQGLSSKMYGVVGGRDTCEFVNNPLVQAGGILASIIPGAGQAAKVAVTGSIKVFIQVAMKQLLKSAAISVGQDVALSMLLAYVVDIGIDMVSGAGVDSENMYGELAGDWIGSGTDEMFSGANGMGGAVPLTPSQAAALESNNNQIVAEYKQSQSSVANPLDTTDPNSFVGSTYQSILKSTGIINSFSSALWAPQKLFATVIASSSQPANAVSADDYRQCEDYRYQDLKVATTPLCHVVRGIPIEYIGLDPIDVSEELFAAGQIDETGAPIGSEYNEFIENCFSNFVVGESKDDGGDGGNCQIKGDDEADKRRKALFSVHYVDERLAEVAENGLPEGGGSAAVVGGTGQIAYKNVVYDGSAADPSVIRDDDGTYYVYSTGGVKLRSTDLVNWRKEPSGWRITGKPGQGCIWAPDVAKVGTKYIFTWTGGSTCGPDDPTVGIHYAVGDSAGGPFTYKGLLTNEGYAIDSHIFVDGSQPYLYFGGGVIRVVKLDVAADGNTRTVGPVTNLISKRPGGPTIEGEWVIKRGEWYYLFFSYGRYADRGGPDEYSVKVARSRSPTGQFDPQNDYRPVLNGRDPFRGPGHNSIATDNAGNDWLVYHAWSGGNRALLIDPITYTADGWPQVRDGYPSSGTQQDGPANGGGTSSGNVGSAEGWVWPTNGPITNGNCYNVSVGGLSHAGMDINTPSDNLKVFAMSAGTVVQKSANGGGAGNYILIKATDGTYYSYQHLKAVPTVTGQVTAGQEIGIAGTTGNVSLQSSAAHLHITMARTATLGAYGNHPNNFDPMMKLQAVKPGNYTCLTD